MLARSIARPATFGRAVAARRLHVSCPSMRQVPIPQDVMPKQAQELLQEDYKYLDVRTTEEYAAGHAPASVNVPVVNFGPAGMVPNPGFLQAVEAAFPDKQERLVVGCKSGRRSMMAIDLLSQAGYCELVNLAGGFDLWAGQGLPVVR
ncbi:hypothetical protein HYH02_006267 [Chlamydomonas schloesseri]|uniref:Rhodanese domain-containing protein n=1 Tax=Chlamydomonas schloesseri TaxID=2026947 RepID=A0A835WJN2_9CHLO|nr:hypothetical protein HYH02_006267 [Chlamydomonas schloesseri]|eukprot:KAG2448919.1 hypothetical protein HYH02_006267 [Chlamydomonas schloesseri]